MTEARRLARRWTAGVAFSLALAGAPVLGATAAEPLRVGGKNGATAMLRLIAATFQAVSGAETEVVPSLGTTGALDAIGAGRLDLILMGRPLSPHESARGLGVRLDICTPFVFATSRSAPPSLAAADVASLYAGAAPRWPDGTPLRIVLRPRHESDNATLADLFPGLGPALAQARARDAVPTAIDDQENLALGARMAGSLVATTLNQVVLEKPPLRMVPIDGVAPGVETYESGRYPHGKRLSFVARTGMPSAAGDYLAFLRSPDGLALLRGVGVLPCPRSG